MIWETLSWIDVHFELQHWKSVHFMSVLLITEMFTVQFSGQYDMKTAEQEKQNKRASGYVQMDNQL